MNNLSQLAKEIIMETKKSGGSFIHPSELKIGGRYTHPGTGETVEIKSGYYLDPINNRVSNFWSWVKILDNGESGEEGCGYWKMN